MRLVHDGAGDPVVFSRPPGATVRMCVPAADPGTPATLRALVVADVLRRILEDHCEVQVFTTVVRPRVASQSHEWALLDHLLRALWIPPPAQVIDAFPDDPVHVLADPAGRAGARGVTARGDRTGCRIDVPGYA